MAKYYGTPLQEMQDTLDDYRKFVAPRAKAWQDWKNGSDQTSDNKQEDIETADQESLNLEE
ncbi:hypothetical protein [Listeria monocytogenes]|uniref:hypothetical protein n=1 Tax=Listeria monocytogenes TaxID=1639 RepID=UPI002155CA4D|nr:hypothetical protein [Listeria monocytogenes]